MSKGTIVKSSEVVAFKVNDSYFSKMLIDRFNSESERLQINEGLLKAGCRTPGGIHKYPYDEVYYVIKGIAILHIDGEDYEIGPGAVVFIPGGTFHALENKSNEDFIFLTIWPLHPEQGVNEVYDMRIDEWGKSFKTVND